MIRKILPSQTVQNMWLPYGSEEEPVDIWEDNSVQIETDSEADAKPKVESPILSETFKTTDIKIDEEQVDTYNNTIVGLFDPEENRRVASDWARALRIVHY